MNIVGNHQRRAVAGLVSGIVVMLLSCSNTSSPPDVRRQLLTDLTDIVYIPTLRAFADEVPRLSAAIDTLCAEPTAVNAVSAQSVWREVRRPWKQAEAFSFGPVDEQRLDSAIDFWPVRVADIEEQMALDSPITDDYIAGLGASRKGLPVIEYLLFADWQRLHTDGMGNRNCAYAAALARAVVGDAEKLVDAWEPHGNDFRAALVTAGEGSATYDKLADAISDSANAIFIAVEKAESNKLARPLGSDTGGTPQPSAVESRYSDNAVADLIDNIIGVRHVYTSTYAGLTGESYSATIARIDAALDQEVSARLDECETALVAIDTSLSDAITTSPAQVEAALTCTMSLLRLLKVDVAGVLGVTPTFGDVDGD